MKSANRCPWSTGYLSGQVHSARREKVRRPLAAQSHPRVATHRDLGFLFSIPKVLAVDILATMQIPEELVAKCKSLNRPAIIAISGFGGAGKSTFANALGAKLDAPVIGIDSFARDRLEKGSLWEAMDFDRLEKEVLIPFSANTKLIEYGHYDWGRNDVMKTKLAEHNGFLILEGVGLLRPNLNKYFSYKIWIDCPKEEAVRRGKKRDREEYKNPRDENWDGIWMKNDTEYFETFKPKEVADFVFSNCD
mgnify:FL=1